MGACTDLSCLFCCFWHCGELILELSRREAEAAERRSCLCDHGNVALLSAS